MEMRIEMMKGMSKEMGKGRDRGMKIGGIGEARIEIMG